MSQRKSGYSRKRNDAYQTPAWVGEVLCRHIPRRVKLAWEPAAGKGQLVKVLRDHGIKVLATDLATGTDFLKTVVDGPCPAIITNPPFGMADEFVRHALELTRPSRGLVAMLVRIDFDSGVTRTDIFRDHPAWHKKIVLMRRIVWFKKKNAAPSYNHCWAIWDWRCKVRQTMVYEP